MNDLSITQSDELKLRWHFGARGALLEHSNAGAQFEMAEARNKARFTCPVCDGDGVLCCGSTAAKKCSRCGGGGQIERNIHGEHVPRTGYIACHDCGGVAGNRDCRHCRGDGYMSVLVAFCAHEDEALMVCEADEVMLQRQGEMIRNLAHVPDELKALAARYFGPEGDRWARTRRGRIFSLYDLTQAGRKLLTMSPKAHKRLTELERIGMLAEADKRIPEHGRTRLLAEAYLEARALYGEFAATWAKVTGGAQ